MMGSLTTPPDPAASDQGGQTASSNYIEFEVLSEPWSRYQLSDGTVLRVRFLLQKLRRGSEAAEQPGLQAASLSSQVIVVSEAPESLRGSPGPVLQVNEFEQHVDKEVSFRPLSAAPSVYRFQGTRVLTAAYSPIRVRRLDVYGPDGDRQYAVETAATVSIVTLPTVVPGTRPDQDSAAVAGGQEHLGG